MKNEAGASGQREYEARLAEDRAGRRERRGRSIAVFIGVVAVVTVVVFGCLQLLNRLFESWQESLPGQAGTSRTIFTPGIVALLTLLAALVTALATANLLWGSRQSTENYFLGAEGERKVAKRLERLVADGWVVIHDRRIPGRRENIDHLAIGPSGVAVIDAKNWKGRAVVTSDGLRFNGRNEQKTLAQLDRQARAVLRVLDAADHHVDVRKVVCFVRADIDNRGTRKEPARPGDTRVCGLPGLIATVTDDPVVLSAAQVDSIASVLDRTLESA